jgi:hypothetical protein
MTLKVETYAVAIGHERGWSWRIVNGEGEPVGATATDLFNSAAAAELAGTRLKMCQNRYHSRTAVAYHQTQL